MYRTAQEWYRRERLVSSAHGCRSRVPSVTRHAFSRPEWHFRDFFWKRRTVTWVTCPTCRFRRERDRAAGVIQGAIGGQQQACHGPRDRCGVDAAIVGDVHEPLHCSARVTAQEPQGDHGGNDFMLDPANQNLHHYWDTMIDKGSRGRATRRRGCTCSGWPARSKPRIRRRASRGAETGKVRGLGAGVGGTDTGRLLPGVAEAQPGPSESYRSEGSVIAMKRAALSGYRLAAMLEDVLGQ